MIAPFGAMAAVAGSGRRVASNRSINQPLFGGVRDLQRFQRRVLPLRHFGFEQLVHRLGGCIVCALDQ